MSSTQKKKHNKNKVQLQINESLHRYKARCHLHSSGNTKVNFETLREGE